ncbi:MAG: ABC transporter permease [bacterium]|nr:ABC transporter permease [bacterium]
MKTSKSRILKIFHKEILHIIRGRMLPLLVVAPILQMLVFGDVVTTEIKHISIMVVDRSLSSYSRLLISKFSNVEYFDLKTVSNDRNDIQTALTKGDVKCVLSIPEDFEEKIKKGEKTSLQFITDGSNSNVGSAALNYGSIIIYNFSKEIFSDKMRQFGNVIGHIPDITIEERILFNPELKSTDTMIPGIIGLILIIVTMVIASLSLVKEKEYGNIEQLIVTPIKPYELLLGKILPYIIIGLIDVIFITVAGILIFKVPFMGNILLLLVLSLLAIFVNLGIGTFISTISATQQQAMISAMFFMLPNMLLSGFIFPIKNMPQVIQYITYIMPLRYYIVILRGIFLKGLTFMELLPEVTALFIYALVVSILALKKFKKTVG